MRTMTGKSTFRPRLSELDLCAWVGNAAPGEVIEYHRGFLACDRLVAAAQWSPAERAELTRMVRRALWCAEAGLVHLVQRRNGPGDYSYLAVKRPRARAAMPTMLVVPPAEEAA